jgi:uncharacterized protein YbjT (DUF2867 family)
MITVMGATGRTGSKIAIQLLGAGEPVRAVGRSAGRLAELASAGAEPVVGDTKDPEFLAGAFRGADAVYAMLPADPTWSNYHAEVDRLGEAVAAAIRDSGVRYVVALSSLGAERAAGTGFMVSLYRQEQRLRALPHVNVLALRAGLFFESFASALDVIIDQGIYADTVAPDTPIPMVATHDLADAAATALRARDWDGFVVREVLGQRDLTFREVTAILGERIGRPGLPYVQLPEAEMLHALTEAGLSADVAAQTLDTNRAMSDRTIRSREGHRPENTTPTRFEEFADELVSAYATRSA